ncbi:ABC transporter ATP-binding protein [Maritimibacter sp. UBA3975]|uniref:ABC transporter ATP-binding protein n=1 Tax=Maritimibacter sp. UBA3975 TaxID=1946833 RepID=UPI000C0AC088|nr:ABC transporter ATP-binding protein [Maritimibacter sp. UBA3975]MAM61295.1 ABC transporter ATP-binding protein [Maritimibacter sp.]|tara:strand:- start:2032 stop:2739 length:708 start_codon:yes stop_codon:yes gene_type:complete
MTTLTINDLHVSYGGVKALRGVSLRVEEGEMVALIGSNGAGKSTLLNALSNVVKRKSGEVIFEGTDTRGMSPYAVSRSGLLHVPEGRQVLSDMSVYENLQVGLIARGKRKTIYSLDHVYELFPVLEERRDQISGTLSGGQQQMLAIGRALMGGPHLLLLDEPSLGLSPLITDQVFDALKKLNAEGLTVLLVEQNAHRALEATSRAYVLDRGQISFEGASSELAGNKAVIDSYLGA